MSNSDSGKGMKATVTARRRLTERYPNEYKEILREERLALGLSPEPSKGPSADTIRRQLEKAEKRVQDLRAKLNQS